MFVKNTPLRVVFSTLFSVFGYPDEKRSFVRDMLLSSEKEKSWNSFSLCGSKSFNKGNDRNNAQQCIV